MMELFVKIVKPKASPQHINLVFYGLYWLAFAQCDGQSFHNQWIQETAFTYSKSAMET